VVFTVQLQERLGDLDYYVPPLAVQDLPSDMTSGQFVSLMDTASAALPSPALPATDALGVLLTGTDHLMVVLGEAGSGKSLFTWTCVQRCLETIEERLRGTPVVQPPPSVDPSASSVRGGDSTPTPSLWLPLVIDLKQYKASELGGLLPRYLASPEACGLPAEAVAALREGATIPGLGVVGLLVLCDGFDELQAEGSEDATAVARLALKDLYCLLCGVGAGAVWQASTLRMVVTSRESRLRDRGDENAVFGAHARRLLLPFSTGQVRAQ
jgi:hypothetical protein